MVYVSGGQSLKKIDTIPSTFIIVLMSSDINTEYYKKSNSEPQNDQKLSLLCCVYQ